MRRTTHLQAVCCLLLLPTVIISSTDDYFKSTPQCDSIGVVSDPNTVVRWECSISLHSYKESTDAVFQFTQDDKTYTNVSQTHVICSKSVLKGYPNRWFYDVICTLSLPLMWLKNEVYTFKVVWPPHWMKAPALDLTFKATHKCEDIKVIRRPDNTFVTWTCASSFYINALVTDCVFRYKANGGAYKSVDSVYVTGVTWPYIGQHHGVWFRDKRCTFNVALSSFTQGIYTFNAIWKGATKETSLDLSFKSSPECSSILMANNGSSVQPSIVVLWTCAMTYVRGEESPTCFFRYKNQASRYYAKSAPMKDVETSEQERPNHVYIDKECTMALPVNHLVPGSHTFQTMWVTPASRPSLESSPVTLGLSKPTCDEPILSNNNQEISMSCKVSGMYPEVSSQMQYIKSNSKYYIKGTTAKMVLSCSESLLTCSGQWIVSQDIRRLRDGDYRFRVLVKPALVEAYAGVDGIPSDDSKPVRLAFPEVELHNCPEGGDQKNGYIRAGTTATCECSVTSPGIPPGHPQWYKADGQAVSTESLNKIRVEHFVGNSNPSYICKGVSPLGQGNPVEYSPKFAHGPAYILISANNNKDFNKCIETDTFDVYCDFKRKDVNPRPAVKMEGVVKSEVIPLNVFETNDFYRHGFKINAATFGFRNITCVAHNPAFPDIKVENSKLITINAPPLSPPIMTINNGAPIISGSQETAVSGQTIVIKCRVEGGFPPVRKVSLVCGGRTSVTEGVETVLLVEPNEEVDGQKCECKAEHQTKCYEKTTEFTLKVHYNPYSPTVTKFTANSQSQTLVVDDGDTVALSCTAEGNPRPTLTIRGQRSVDKALEIKDVITGNFEKTSSFTTITGCLDTDTYVCTANNDAGVDKRSVSVFVKCPPHLSLTKTVDKDLNATLGLVSKLGIPVYGHPRPTTYALDKGNDTLGRAKRDLKEGSARSGMFNVTYEAGVPPEGTVVLRMYDLTVEDSGRYVLTITNGIGTGLEFAFNLYVMEESSGPGEQTEAGNDTATYAGAAVAIILLLVIIAIVAFLVLRRKGRFPNRCGALDKKKTSWHAPLKDNADTPGGILQPGYYFMEYRDPDHIEETPNVVYGMGDGDFEGEDVVEVPNVVYGMKDDNFPTDEVVEIPNIVYGMGTVGSTERQVTDSEDYSEINDREVMRPHHGVKCKPVKKTTTMPFYNKHGKVDGMNNNLSKTLQMEDPDYDEPEDQYSQAVERNTRSHTVRERSSSHASRPKEVTSYYGNFTDVRRTDDTYQEPSSQEDDDYDIPNETEDTYAQINPATKRSRYQNHTAVVERMSDNTNFSKA